jgi:hypothetical protein
LEKKRNENPSKKGANRKGGKDAKEPGKGEKHIHLLRTNDTQAHYQTTPGLNFYFVR